MSSKGLNNILLKINTEIMCQNWNLDIERNPMAHRPMNPLILTIKEELRYLNSYELKNRTTKMRKLYIEDFLREENELRRVDLAYINTQP